MRLQTLITGFLFFSLVILLVSCKSMAVDNEMKPAVLTAASSEQTEILSKTISEILNGRKVSLAKNSFINDHRLVLEKSMRNPIGMQGMLGRIEGKPSAPSFLLFIRGGNCYLVYEKTGQEYLVDGLDCKAL